MVTFDVMPFLRTPRCYQSVPTLLARLLFALAVGLAVAPSIHAQSKSIERLHTIKVPFDYSDPSLGVASLSFEFGAPFDKSKPTILVIADGQQFFVRAGNTAELQKGLFGNAFNVVGVITRGTTPAFINKTLTQGTANWPMAWRVFNSVQWINDIDAVRRQVAGARGMILLYGRSGGAYLVHQYLAKYGRYVERAFTQAPVNPILNRELGIDLDRFWTELGEQDPNLQTMLREALKRHADDRLRILITFQRQHFFVPADKLAAARGELIRALAKDDTNYYERVRKEYEVDEVLKLQESSQSIAQVVRVFELIYPSGAFQKLGGEAIHPLLETQQHFIKPLLDLVQQRKIPEPSFDLHAIRNLNTEAFIVTGRWDEAVDYRTSIALAYSFRNQHLFIADDNHTLQKLDQAEVLEKMIVAFLRFGLKSSQFNNALASAKEFRWSAL